MSFTNMMLAPLSTAGAAFHAAYAALPEPKNPAERIDRFTLAVTNAGAKVLEQAGLSTNTQVDAVRSLGALTAMAASGLQAVHEPGFFEFLNLPFTAFVGINTLFSPTPKGDKNFVESRMILATILASFGLLASGTMLLEPCDAVGALISAGLFGGLFFNHHGSTYIAATRHLPATAQTK